MDVKEDVLVAATVKGKEELDDGYAVTLDVPAFKSKYPTKVYGCSAAEAKTFKAGNALNIRLTRGKLQDGKDGGQYWHYNWRWGSLSGEAPAVQPPDGGNGHEDERNRSIQRQVALKAAVDLAVARIATGDKVESPRVLQVAQIFDNWLRGLGAGQPTRAPSRASADEPPSDEEDAP